MRNNFLLCESTTVTVTAQDNGGLEATQQFTVRRSNSPPVPSSGTFPHQTIDVGESSPLYMGNWFSDPDTCDSRLTYKASSSDASRVTASASGNTVTIVGVSVGNATVTVTAQDTGGLKATMDIQVTVIVSKPGAPTGLTATADGQTEIDLSWTAPSDDGGAAITGYKVEVSSDGSSWSDLDSNTDSTSTSYSHTGLTAASTRHYRVSAINSAGTGTASNVDSATTSQAAAGSPDLVVNNTLLSANVTPGYHLSLNATVQNEGVGSSAPTTLRYYSSADTTITTGDTQVGTDPVDGLVPSGSSREAIGVTAPATPGTYYYGACVDSVSGESNTTNNCSSATEVTVRVASSPTPTPNPTTKAVSGSISSCDGEQLAPGIDSYRITITGTVIASRTVENVTVSGTFNDSFVGIDIVGDMAADETAMFSISGIVTESVGTCGAELEWIEIS